MLKSVGHFLVFSLFTVATQTGGFIYLLVLYASKRLKLDRVRFALFFAVSYLITTFFVTPFIAPVFGRTPLPYRGNLRPLNLITCFLNRHYVKPSLKKQLTKAAEEIASEFVGTQTNYLDANFPFFDGFPLFPHLSHNDGKKADLAFYYLDTKTDKRVNHAPSWIGYGVYDEPTDQEVNYPKRCSDQGFWQYGILMHLTPQWRSDALKKVDRERTRELLIILVKDKLTSKIFIEPHLKNRWQLDKYDKIRFHGCQAVRHDDHIHVQIK